MEVFTDPKEFRTRQEIPTAVTVGTFDGVHSGHRQLLRKLKEKAQQSKLAAVVVTFDNHPNEVVTTKGSPPLLSTCEEKLYLLGRTGVDYTFLFHFDRSIADLSAEEFVECILVGQLGMKELVIGFDHVFGKDKSGSRAVLEELGRRFGFGVEILSPVNYKGWPISSSRIRESIQNGEFQESVKMLGYPYLLFARPVKGRGRGKELGYPTINFECPPEKLLPGDGVYAGWVELPQGRFGGMLYVGTAPTFDDGKRRLEVHLFDYEDGDTPDFIHLEIEAFIRNDRRFEHPEDLVEQLRKDEQLIRRLVGTGELRKDLFAYGRN